MRDGGTETRFLTTTTVASIGTGAIPIFELAHATSQQREVCDGVLRLRRAIASAPSGSEYSSGAIETTPQAHNIRNDPSGSTIRS
jgi:hypothetical protein